MDTRNDLSHLSSYKICILQESVLRFILPIVLYVELNFQLYVFRTCARKFVSLLCSYIHYIFTLVSLLPRFHLILGTTIQHLLLPVTMLILNSRCIRKKKKAFVLSFPLCIPFLLSVRVFVSYYKHSCRFLLARTRWKEETSLDAFSDLRATI